VISRFSSHKMVGDYGKRYYLSASERMESLLRDHAVEARGLSGQRDRLVAHWHGIRIQQPVLNGHNPLRVGDSIHVEADVHLGILTPNEVLVDLYYGTLKAVDALQASLSQEMHVKEDRGNGRYLYACDLTCQKTGRYGFTARVSPKGDAWITFAPGLITWAEGK